MRKLGSVDIDHFCEHARIEPLLAAFFAQHIKRWAGTPFPSLFLDGKQRAFYHKLSEFVSSRGWLRFTRVSLDNEPVAFHFGFLFQNAFLWYKPCFDINGAHQSPGEVLLRALLLQSREEGAEVFDFGLGDEPFKSRFATRVDKVRTWGLYPCGQVCGSSIEVSNRCKFS
jgi:CelD/BcsL family acetyltransferase involved in cellulose biosynthesis